MPVNIKIQEPNGQQISVIAHYNAEMEDFLRSVDLNRYNVERNVFGLSPNKAAAAFLNVNFRSPNSSLGATGYNGKSVSNLTANQPSVYYIELIRGSDFERRVRTAVSQSMRTREVGGGNSTFTGGGLTETGRGSGVNDGTIGGGNRGGGGSDVFNPVLPENGGGTVGGGSENGNRGIIIITEADWRNLNFHQVTERRRVEPPTGGPDPRDPGPGDPPPPPPPPPPPEDPPLKPDEDPGAVPAATTVVANELPNALAKRLGWRELQERP